jgi:mono/diheme cytochrome c family protein
MSKPKIKAEVKRQKAKARTKPLFNKKRFPPHSFLLPFAFLLTLVSGCRMDMQDQPRYEAYEKSNFFKDGLASRTSPQGTVARGMLREDIALYTGKRERAGGGAASGSGQAAASSGGQNQGGGGDAQTSTTGTGSTTANTQANTTYPDDVDTFPFPVTPEVVARGQERYQIFCSACHGDVGYGDGMIVRRGYRRPQSFHTDQLRGAPVGHFFDVMTNGWGAMPSYAPQVPVRDRWAIVAYIRALQLSQNQQAGTEQQPPAPTNPPALARPESQQGGQR